MKNLRLSLGAFALIATVVMLFAFKPAPEDAGKLETIYYFNGTVVEDAIEPTLWSDDPNSLPCGEGEVLPCQVTLTESIESYLSGKTYQQVMADGDVSKRSD